MRGHEYNTQNIRIRYSVYFIILLKCRKMPSTKIWEGGGIYMYTVHCKGKESQSLRKKGEQKYHLAPL